jgi:hypothetical protein
MPIKEIAHKELFPNDEYHPVGPAIEKALIRNHFNQGLIRKLLPIGYTKDIGLSVD